MVNVRPNIMTGNLNKAYVHIGLQEQNKDFTN